MVSEDIDVSAFWLGFLVSLVLLTAVGATSDGTCHRWNCPCSGLRQNYRPSVSKRWYENYHSDAESARRHTKDIVDKMISDRFRDDDHIALLRDCSNRRNTECTHAHMQHNCTLDGLPSLPLITRLGEYDFSATQSGLLQFAHQTRSLLAKLAVFVDQARRDEERLIRSHRHSMANEISLLEEQHLYHILCNLHVDFNRKKISLSPEISRELMQIGCRLLNTQAPIDNRNFMIFYTLERLLHNVSIQFRRVLKRKESDHDFKLKHDILLRLMNGN